MAEEPTKKQESEIAVVDVDNMAEPVTLTLDQMDHLDVRRWIDFRLCLRKVRYTMVFDRRLKNCDPFVWCTFAPK